MAQDPGSNRQHEAALRRLREAKARFGRQLLSHPDVHGLGIGYRRVGGRKTADLALVVHVYRKSPREDVERTRLLPSELIFFSEAEHEEVSVPVDVRERPVPIPEVECGDCSEDLGGRFRPVRGGCSGGLAAAPGGTLGGWVWDRTEGLLALLSNEHVLGSAVGDVVIQPSIGDGGASPGDDIGSVLRAGTLDVSLAAPLDGDLISTEIVCSGPAVFEITDATLDMVVEKVGQTTGLTCGIVDLIDYDSGHYGSRADLWIDGDGADFSMAGDSGSLYVERENPSGASWKRVVGIHWGGSGDDGVGHPIGPVFTDLNLATVCGGLVEALIDAIFRAEAEPEHELAVASGAGPIGARAGVPRKAFHDSLARSLEKRITGTGAGRRMLDVLRQHRVDLVRLLLDGDGWRAALAALHPVVGGRVTTDEILDHEISESDARNLSRLASVGRRLTPDMAEAFSMAEDLLAQARGRRMQDVFLAVDRDDSPAGS